MGAAKKLDNIVWESQPGSQLLLLTCPVFECLYEGTRGPGKTDTLLMDFVQHVGQGYGSDWKGILFRREYKELADVEKKSKKWFYDAFPGAKFLASQSEYKWRFPDGEELLFRHAKTEDDYWDYHGHEYPWIGWEELTLWPDEALYDTMKSVCRSSNPDVPRKYRSTANPWGRGHHWVKKRFIDPAPAGKIIYDGQGRQRVRITGYIFENRFIVENDREYILNVFGQKDQNKRKAWGFADWDIAAGGFFADFWEEKKHVVPNFNPPKSWEIGCSFDWGSAKPASLGIWAISDGTQPDMPGLPYFPRGSAIRIDELYTVLTDRHGEPEANKGLGWSNNRLGQEVAKLLLKWEKKQERRFTRNVADPSIWTEDGGDSIYDQMVGKSASGQDKATGAKAENYNLSFDRADNSRDAGWGKMKELLEESAKPRAESPGIWIMERCKNFRRTVPVLPRETKNPDDLDTESEDHIADDARYFVMSLSTKKKVKRKKLSGF
jgi:hypothetical protein